MTDEQPKDKWADRASVAAAWIKKRLSNRRLIQQATRAAVAASTAAVIGTVVLVGTGVVANPFQDATPAAEQPDLTPLLDRIADLESNSDDVRQATLDLAGDLATLDALLVNGDRDQVRDAVEQVRAAVAAVEAIANAASQDAADAAAALAALPVDDLTGRIEGIDGTLDLVADALANVRDDLGAATTVANAAASAAAEAAQTAGNATSAADGAAASAQAAAESAQAVAEDLAALSDDVDVLVADVAANAAEVAELSDKVDDLAAAVEQDRADVAVALSQLEQEIDAVEARLPAAFAILGSVSSDGETVRSAPVEFSTPGEGTDFVRWFYRFSFTPNFSTCGSVTIYVDGNFTRTISADNSAGRTITYAASTSLRPGDHAVEYEVSGGGRCLIIEPTYTLLPKT